MRKTKIVCTIGPASHKPEILKEMVEAGMDVARLNLSHGSTDDHRQAIRMIVSIAGQAGRPLATMLDTRGPEIRLGRFKDGRAHFTPQARVRLTPETVLCTEDTLAVNYPRVAQALQEGDRILLDEGTVVLEVLSIEGRDVLAQVVSGGELTDHKKVTLPGVALDLDIVPDADRADIAMGVEEGVDYIAASFIRTPDDVVAIRRVIEECEGKQGIIAKIESEQGVENLPAILKLSDGLMVARGDLGVELNPEEVPLVQKRMIELANRAGKPVITATQMLESMVARPKPTRAEASDVANAIFDGTDAVMLSAETATGQYPVEAVRVMHRIAVTMEEALDYRSFLAKGLDMRGKTITDAVSHASAQAAYDLEARAIISATESGYTARMVAKYRPRVPVLAVTPHPSTRSQLALIWGVHPLLAAAATNTDELVDKTIATVLEAGYIIPGDVVVVTAGVPAGIPGTTNLLQVHTVGDILVRGSGIGQSAASGPVCVATTAADVRRKCKPGDILVTAGTDRDFVPYLEEASGIIAEEGGLTSHAAILGLNLGIPVIVGAGGATRLLEDGHTVTIDAQRGLVYRGPARIL